MLLSQYHLTPEYILSNWTKEEFDLMLDKMSARYEKLNKPNGEPGNIISDDEAFKTLGIKPQKAKKPEA